MNSPNLPPSPDRTPYSVGKKIGGFLMDFEAGPNAHALEQTPTTPENAAERNGNGQPPLSDDAAAHIAETLSSFDSKEK